MNAVLAFLDAYRGVILIATVVIIMAIEWAGRQGSLWLMEKAFGVEFAERYDTRWTAIGVIHHELSHLLVALFTGARIDKFRLYRFKREEGDKALGYVNYTPRGLFLLPLLQKTAIGIAPALFGSLNVCLLGWYIMQVWQNGGTAAALCEPGVWVAAILKELNEATAKRKATRTRKRKDLGEDSETSNSKLEQIEIPDIPDEDPDDEDDD